MMIDRFHLEVTPTHFADGRSTEWRVEVDALGQRYDFRQLMPRVDFRGSELEVYLDVALAEFRRLTLAAAEKSREDSPK